MNVVGFLLAYALVLASPFAGAAPLMISGALAGLLVVRDLVVRARHRKATPDEIEAEDSRVIPVPALEPVRVATPGPAEPTELVEPLEQEQGSRYSAR